MSGYCDIAPGHEWHGPYHDSEYGFPVRDEALLFERLILEISQAGLSWLTILKKRDALRSAYDGFNVDKVASYDEKDRARLLADPRIIRNKLKVNAAISNARTILAMRGSDGGFVEWLDAQGRITKDEWVKQFKNTFRFTGREITQSFLMSTGYLPGAHDQSCPVFAKVIKKNPPWMAHF